MLTKVKTVEEDKARTYTYKIKDINLFWISKCAKTTFINLFLR